MKSKAFTLIELLVVIAIIAILASLLLTVISKAKEHGKRAYCIANEKNLTLALQMFVDDNNELLPNTAYQGCNGGNKTLWVSGYLNHYSCTTDSTNINLLINNKYSQFSGYISNHRIYKCPSDKKSYEIKFYNNEEDSFPTISSILRSEKVRSYSLNWSIGWIEDGTSVKPARFYNKLNLIYTPAQVTSFIDVNSDSICWSFFGAVKDSIFMYPAIYHNKSSTISFLDGHIISKKWKTDAILSPKPLRESFHNHGESSKNNLDIEWLFNNSISK